MEWMKQYAKNVHSQGGEDGIIEFLLDNLEITGGVCLEIGAWDGRLLSNTLALVKRGFHSVMVEGDPGRYKALEKTAEEFAPRITPVQLMVSGDNLEGIETTLDALTYTEAVLSIDIDGTEPQILQTLSDDGYGFAVAVVEWCGMGKKHPWKLLGTAKECGYTPVACTHSNIIFVGTWRYAAMCEKLAETIDEG